MFWLSYSKLPRAYNRAKGTTNSHVKPNILDSFGNIENLILDVSVKNGGFSKVKFENLTQSKFH